MWCVMERRRREPQCRGRALRCCFCDCDCDCFDGCSGVLAVLLSAESSAIAASSGLLRATCSCSARAVLATASSLARVRGANDEFEVRLELRDTSAIDIDMRSVEKGRCGRDGEGEPPVCRWWPKLRANGSTSRSCCEDLWSLIGVRAS